MFEDEGVEFAVVEQVVTEHQDALLEADELSKHSVTGWELVRTVHGHLVYPLSLELIRLALLVVNAVGDLVTGVVGVNHSLISVPDIPLVTEVAER